MTSRIFFNPDDIGHGNVYEFEGFITTSDGDTYELDEWLGRGGNATVFSCRRRETGDDYAIKFLLNDNYYSRLRFQREVSLLKKLTHEHITRYFGSGQLQIRRTRRKLQFVIMELAERNLDSLMRESKVPMDYELYAGQFRGLAKALAILHEFAVHRDIKPENILINGDRWLLSDYGLCSFVTPTEEDLTQVGRNMGPKFWLSPEAHNHRLGCADKINGASDVYQLAAVFWYVVTGRHPSGIVEQDDWSGPSKLFELLRRSLFHNSTKRPKDGTEFLRDLEAALSV